MTFGMSLEHYKHNQVTLSRNHTNVRDSLFLTPLSNLLQSMEKNNLGLYILCSIFHCQLCET